MMNEVVSSSLSQLLGQSPLLLVYLVGVVLALVFWRRFTRASAYLIAACAILFVVSIAQTGLIQYLIVMMTEWGWDHQQLSSTLGAVSIIGVILRCIAFGLLFGSVFAGRQTGSAGAAIQLSSTGKQSMWSFRGRIGRGAFLARFTLLFLANLIVSMLVQILIAELQNADDGAGLLALILLIFLPFEIVIVWLSLAMQAQRWHDLDKSGWMIFLNLTLIALPVILIVFAFVQGTAGANRYGHDPLAAQ